MSNLKQHRFVKVAVTYQPPRWAFFVASLLFHLVLFAAYDRLGFYTVPASITEFEIMPRPESSGYSDKRVKASRNHRPFNKSAKLRLRDFGVGSTWGDLNRKYNQEPPSNGNIGKSKWTSSEAYATDQMTAFDGLSLEEIRFINSLWREVDKAIQDSPYLSEYNHTGKVYFYFELDDNGLINESSLHACGSDSVLKVIAARAIRKAIKNENREIHFLGSSAIFSARFSWADYESCKDLRGIHQNYLSFCHYAENKRKSFSTGEKASKYLESLNYGFGAIEEIEKYNREENHRNTQFDPFVDMHHDPDWNLGC